MSYWNDPRYQRLLQAEIKLCGDCDSASAGECCLEAALKAWERGEGA